IRLSAKDLALATPARDNLEGLVDYLKHPTTYDGEIDISIFHPSTDSADIFRYMRNVTKDELVDLAGYILYEVKTKNKTWGCGKTCN
ncbi:MAG: cytochrome c-550, partial [Moorea sp. SIO3C2]|nr:cytochrome c-550 [Moorena sp. SIO3C2]